LCELFGEHARAEDLVAGRECVRNETCF
jgi:hypothetical protein